jgi:hypothetical protein
MLKLFHQGDQPVTAVGDVVLLDGEGRAIEQYNTMRLCSPVDPDKITKSLIQDCLLFFYIRDAFVITVLALIRRRRRCSPLDFLCITAQP